MQSLDAVARQARHIWHAGVDAVRADRLVQATLSSSSTSLQISEFSIPLQDFNRVVVVGAGKASGYMALGLKRALRTCGVTKEILGLVNVPDNQPDLATTSIALQRCRPVGINLPTPHSVQATSRIIELVSSLENDDLCIGLFSGGGSALLSSPRHPVVLDDKIKLFEFLSRAGATISQINTVRSRISNVKGGHLAAQCTAPVFITLILSDVMGDPLDLIASGPTVPGSSTNRDALEVLTQFDPRREQIPVSIFEVLESPGADTLRISSTVQNILIGNNRTAVDAACKAACQLGYRVICESNLDEGRAEDSGRRLADQLARIAAESEKVCIVSGGEPVVQLADASVRGMGGRNQQLVLAALQRLRSAHSHLTQQPICLLSGGTDGEDGVTSAAGAWIDAGVIGEAQGQQLDIDDYLSRNDSHSFFRRVGGLFTTGPTATNVCDLRVALFDPGLAAR